MNLLNVGIRNSISKEKVYPPSSSSIPTTNAFSLDGSTYYASKGFEFKYGFAIFSPAVIVATYGANYVGYNLATNTRLSPISLYLDTRDGTYFLQSAPIYDAFTFNSFYSVCLIRADRGPLSKLVIIKYPLVIQQEVDNDNWTDYYGNKFPTLVKINDTRFLAIGNSRGSPISNCELVNYSSAGISSITATTSYPIVTSACGGTVLKDGRVLIVGGETASYQITKSCYIGTISGNSISWVASTPLPISASSISVILLDNGKIMTVGGRMTDNHTTSAYVGTVSGNSITWREIPNIIPISCWSVSAKYLDGKLYIIYSVNDQTPMSCKIINSPESL